MSEQNLCPSVKTVSGSAPLNSLPIAMSYFPMSRWEALYLPETALEKGTLFRCLDLPFVGKEAVSDGKESD